MYSVCLVFHGAMFVLTDEDVLDVVLVDGDGGCVHEVQQLAQGLRVEVLEDHGAAVLLEEARLEHPVKVGRAGAEDELVSRKLSPLRHKHCVGEPILNTFSKHVFLAQEMFIFVRSYIRFKYV